MRWKEKIEFLEKRKKRTGKSSPLLEKRIELDAPQALIYSCYTEIFNEKMSLGGGPITLRDVRDYLDLYPEVLKVFDKREFVRFIKALEATHRSVGKKEIENDE